MTGSVVRLARCVAVALLCAAPQSLAAQGVTSAALTGRVTDDQGNPISTAVIELVNPANGQRYTTRVNGSGRYFFENLQVGGPYTIDVKALGHEPARQTDIYFRLGQRMERDFTLKATAVEVNAVVVTAEQDPLANTARTGAQTFVSESLITRLPTLSRNFTDFIRTVPQVGGANNLSVGGQNERFNNIQIDGGVNNDIFGLSGGSGVPGGGADAHPISLEAVKEYQVMIAPFDIRQGGFTGGLINAVTQSGTNQFHGSIFGFLQNENLIGTPYCGPVPTGQTPKCGAVISDPVTEFGQGQYGFSLGGPILRDRLHFFFVTEVQAREAPFSGTSINADTTNGQDSLGVGIRRYTAERVQQIAQSVYNFDPGTWDRPLLDNPDRNIFVKLNAQLATNSQVEVSYNDVNAADDNLTRLPSATGQRDGYQLSLSGYDFTTKTKTLRGKWTTPVGNSLNNELLVAYQTIRDIRELPNDVPLIFVGGDRGGPCTAVCATNIALGAERFSHANQLDQDIIEITDNVTFGTGRHLITLGTHNEFFQFYNVFFPASRGIWSFTDTAAFRAGTPNRFERALPGASRPDGPVANFSVQQYGLYAQDRWNITPRLAITAGFRIDVPMMDAPPTNPVLDTSVLNINTGVFPSGNVMLSPRIGFNYDATGDGATYLRGGIGIFSGRPPYVWVSNAYANTGLEQATLICDGALTGSALDSVPAFTVDPDAQPTACRGPAGLTVPTPSINYFDEDFKFPQTLKISFGVDRQLGWGMVGTVDFLYTSWINQFYYTDANLTGIVNYAAGEGGRAMYGTVGATNGTAAPSRKTTSFRDVLRHRNESADRSYSMTLQLQKRFSDGVEFGLGYTYSRTQDLFSFTSSTANSNFRFTVLDGTLENRNLRTSWFDVPNKIVVSGTANLPFGIRGSLIYTGASGSPYTYVVSNDVNADGLAQNDRVYVPRNQADILLANPNDWRVVDSMINAEPCLNAYRGSLLPRNVCRNPWVSFFDMKFSKLIPSVRGHSFEITADIFNVLRMLSSIGLGPDDWGVVKRKSFNENINLLRATGYDPVLGRARYALAITQPQVITDRFKVQFGARYNF